MRDVLKIVNEVRAIQRLQQQQVARRIATQTLKSAQDLTKFAEDILGFIDFLGIWLTEDQRKLLVYYQAHHTTNCQAGHGVGKTYLAALIVVHWVFCREGRAVTTAPNNNLVENLLWYEIRQLWSRYRHILGGRCLQMKLEKTPHIYAWGFAAQDYNPNAFVGIHGIYLLIVGDEYAGIKRDIDDGILSCAQAPTNKILRIGNPIARGTPFSDHCKDQAIVLAAWKHPNVRWAYELDDSGNPQLKPEVAEQILDLAGNVKPIQDWPDHLPRPIIPAAVSIEWIERVRKLKGESSPYWQSRVLGLFPDDDPRSVVPISLFMRARANYDANPEYWDRIASEGDISYGLDIADGRDRNAIAAWQGQVLRLAHWEPTKNDERDQERAAELAIKYLKIETGSIRVDRGGPGAGVANEIRKLALKHRIRCKVFATRFGEKSPDPDYVNIRAYMYAWQLRQALKTGYAVIAPLGEIEEEVMHQLSAIKTIEKPDEKTALEPKKEAVNALGYSPDLADCIALAALDAYSVPTRPKQNKTSVLVSPQRTQSGIDSY